MKKKLQVRRDYLSESENYIKLNYVKFTHKEDAIIAIKIF